MGDVQAGVKRNHPTGRTFPAASIANLLITAGTISSCDAIHYPNRLCAASTTDANARVMQMADGGFRPGCNVQVTRVAGEQIVADVEVSNHGSDRGLIGRCCSGCAPALVACPKNAISPMAALAARRISTGRMPRASKCMPATQSKHGRRFPTAGFARMVERVSIQAGLAFKAHPHAHATARLWFCPAQQGRRYPSPASLSYQHTVRYTELSLNDLQGLLAMNRWSYGDCIRPQPSRALR